MEENSEKNNAMENSEKKKSRPRRQWQNEYLEREKAISFALDKVLHDPNATNMELLEAVRILESRRRY